MKREKYALYLEEKREEISKFLEDEKISEIALVYMLGTFSMKMRDDAMQVLRNGKTNEGYKFRLSDFLFKDKYANGSGYILDNQNFMMNKHISMESTSYLR